MTDKSPFPLGHQFGKQDCPDDFYDADNATLFGDEVVRLANAEHARAVALAAERDALRAEVKRLRGAFANDGCLCATCIALRLALAPEGGGA